MFPEIPAGLNPPSQRTQLTRVAALQKGRLARRCQEGLSQAKLHRLATPAVQRVKSRLRSHAVSVHMMHLPGAVQGGHKPLTLEELKEKQKRVREVWPTIALN